MTKILCDVYKSPKKPETYLYVSREDQLTRVPEALLETFGKPERALIIVLTEDKKLARVEAKKVMAALKEQGFYLQMPPVEELPKRSEERRVGKECRSRW